MVTSVQSVEYARHPLPNPRRAAGSRTSLESDSGASPVVSAPATDRMHRRGVPPALSARRVTAGSDVRGAPAGTYARVAIALLCGALLGTLYLTVALRRQVDPISGLVSDYVYHPPGAPLFVLVALLMLLGGLLLTAAMNNLGILGGQAVRVLFGLWFAGLLIVAVFPADRTRTDVTVYGELHRLGAAVVLSCLPLACWKLARALRGNRRWAAFTGRIRLFSALSLFAAVAFGLSQLHPTLPQGLLERVALGADVALLAVLALSIAAVERQTR